MFYLNSIYFDYIYKQNHRLCAGVNFQKCVYDVVQYFLITTIHRLWVRVNL